MREIAPLKEKSAYLIKHMPSILTEKIFVISWISFSLNVLANIPSKIFLNLQAFYL